MASPRMSLAAIVLAGSFGHALLAQNAPSDPAPSPGVAGDDRSEAPPINAIRDWRFQFEPSAWYAGAGGKVQIAGAPEGTPEVRLNDLNLDNPKLTPSGELHVRTGNWRFSLGMFFFNQKRDQTMSVGGRAGDIAFNAGDALRSKMSYDSYEPTVGYEFWRHQPPAGEGVDFQARLEVFGGARLEELEFEFRRASQVDSQREFFGQVLAGIKGSLEITEQFSIDLTTSAGGWPGSDSHAWSWDIVAGFMWRPVPNVGVQLGYRNIFTELKSGDGADRFIYNGGLAGLFFGAVVRF